MKIKPLVFNPDGVTYEYNAPTVAILDDFGGESDNSETERKPSKSSKNSSKEPGFYFTEMDIFAFNLRYLGQYLSVEVTKRLLYFAW